jgi:hypothetical protein
MYKNQPWKNARLASCGNQALKQAKQGPVFMCFSAEPLLPLAESDLEHAAFGCFRGSEIRKISRGKEKRRELL